MRKKTKYLYFQGKCKWARLDIPDTKFNMEGRWAITLYPNPASLEQVYELKKEGIRNIIKKDEDGEFITWSRPTQKRMKGQIKAFPPAEILDNEGRPLPRNTGIGNGSDVTVKIEVYYFTTPQKTEGCAARLASVKIDNLVPYSREDFSPEQEKLVKGLDEQPDQF